MNLSLSHLKSMLLTLSHAMTRSRAIMIAAAFFIPVLLFFHGTYSTACQPSEQHRSKDVARGRNASEYEIGRAGNRTFGFQKILVVGLPERSDKKDAMILASSLTGFDVEFVHGIKADVIPDKARPAGFTVSGAYLGSWRGHLNAIRSILEKHLSSALIMEDDMDWDIRILSQMPEFARSVRSLSNVSLTEPQHSPYGDDWDIVWPGNCGDGGYPWPIDEDVPLVATYNDTTVPPKKNMVGLGVLQMFPDYTRVVHRGVQPICTFAYGVSYKGAQKLLALIGVSPKWNIAFDLQLALVCRHRLLGIKCVTVTPTLFMHHRAAGDISRDSDIKVVGAPAGENDTEQVKPENYRAKGMTSNIVHSARLNLEQMILGTDNYTMQW